MEAGAVRTSASGMGSSPPAWPPSAALQRGAGGSATSVGCQPCLARVCVWGWSIVETLGARQQS